MKRLSMIAMLAAVVFGACSKDKGSESKPSCLVTKITQPSGQEYLLSYNADGKLTTIQYPSSTTQVTYSGNTIVALSTGSGGYYNKVTYTLNGNGLPSFIKTEYDATGTTWQTRAYEYQGTQVTKRKLIKSAGNNTETIYVWANDNLVTENITGPTFTQKLEYEYYSDKPYQPGSNAENVVIIERNKNLLKKRTSTFTSNGVPEVEKTSFTYEFDKDGKILSMTEKDDINTGQTPYKYTYEYKCN